MKRDNGRLERALAEAQRVLLEREKEVTKLRTDKLVDVGVAEGSKVSDIDARLVRANEKVEQLKVQYTVCVYSASICMAQL